MRENSELVLDQVRKLYGRSVAVDAVSLAVAQGELVSLLGPSGCGKTTTLRMVAGFIEPTAGSILIQGRDVTRLEPYKRDTAMVFQNYALFPHLSVFDNVAFGLRRRKVPAKEVAKRVREMLTLLELAGLEKRYPRELSGGQQQRVALARALVLNAAVVLLDEPLSNLDAKLRASTRFELRRLQQEFGFTAIFVTHDQEEAMAISDRIAVMNEGRIEQVGTALEIYESPATQFVAQFIGTSNTFSGTVLGWEGDQIRIETPLGVLRGRPATPKAQELAVGASARLLVRAEDLQVSDGEDRAATTDLNVLAGTVEVASYLGASSALSIRVADGSLVVVALMDKTQTPFAPRSSVNLAWPVSRAMVFAA